MVRFLLDHPAAFVALIVVGALAYIFLMCLLFAAIDEAERSDERAFPNR